MTTLETRVEVSVRGPFPLHAKAYAAEKMQALMRLAPSPILRAQIRMTRTQHRAVDEHVVVEAYLDVNGRPVRAQIAARSSHEAIDLVQDRLRRKLSQLGRHPSRQNGRDRAHRPAYAARPPIEREVLRRKTYQPAVSTPEEAAFDMELMDYDFQLFVDASSGLDTVVYRNGHSGYSLSHLAQQPRLSLPGAVGILDNTDLPYVFYTDTHTDRGHVLYRRHDGNYALITPE